MGVWVKTVTEAVGNGQVSEIDKLQPEPEVWGGVGGRGSGDGRLQFTDVITTWA